MMELRWNPSRTLNRIFKMEGLQVTFGLVETFLASSLSRACWRRQVSVPVHRLAGKILGLNKAHLHIIIC
jgi:hypothetical protein